LALYLPYPQTVVEEMRNFMIMLKRTIAAATAAGLFALAGVSGAQAAEPTTPVINKVATTPEQKAAHEAAKAARQAAIAAAKPAIESARATFKAARDGATTEEAKKAAHDAFKAAIATARAGIPGKPIKRVRP
jgi:hypothetical protein